jgi:hypothetical protein
MTKSLPWIMACLAILTGLLLSASGSAPRGWEDQSNAASVRIKSAPKIVCAGGTEKITVEAFWDYGKSASPPKGKSGSSAGVVFIMPAGGKLTPPSAPVQYQNKPITFTYTAPNEPGAETVTATVTYGSGSSEVTANSEPRRFRIIVCEYAFAFDASVSETKGVGFAKSTFTGNGIFRLTNEGAVIDPAITTHWTIEERFTVPSTKQECTVQKVNVESKLHITGKLLTDSNTLDLHFIWDSLEVPNRSIECVPPKPPFTAPYNLGVLEPRHGMPEKWKPSSTSPDKQWLPFGSGKLMLWTVPVIRTEK